MSRDVFGASPLRGSSIEPPPDADPAHLRALCRMLREKVLFLRQVLSSMYAGLVVTDPSGHIRSVNQAIVGLLGYSESELLGTDLRGLLLKAEPSTSEYFVDDILAHADSQVMRTKHGALVDVMMSPTVLFDEDGGIRCVVCTFLDVTDQRRLETELRQIQQFEAIGSLASGIAHEISTPLQFIASNAEYLRMTLPSSGADEDMNAEIDDACGSIEEGVGRIADLVCALKEYAHPAMSRHASGDINASIRRSLTIARHEYRMVATVETDLGELPRVHCNVNDLSRVFLNLITNAAHAIQDAVRESGQRGRIVIRSWQEGENVVVSISDTGSGIPESVRPHIFKRFFTTKEVGRGTGQGLAIAEEVVVRDHGGSLTFETAEGRGTTFFIKLPIRDP